MRKIRLARVYIIIHCIGDAFSNDGRGAESILFVVSIFQSSLSSTRAVNRSITAYNTRLYYYNNMQKCVRTYFLHARRACICLWLVIIFCMDCTILDRNSCRCSHCPNIVCRPLYKALAAHNIYVTGWQLIIFYTSYGTSV